MSDNNTHGTIVWQDLTVPDAARIRDFYAAVAGWRAEPVDMGGYADFNMLAPGEDTPVAGICHAQGPNAKVPPQWLVYINVPDLEAALKACLEGGGAVVDGPRGEGSSGRMAVIRDPAGAHAALFEAAAEQQD